MTFGEGVPIDQEALKVPETPAKPKEFPIGQQELQPAVTPRERMERARFEGTRKNLAEATGYIHQAEFATRLAEHIFEKHPGSPLASRILDITTRTESESHSLNILEERLLALQESRGSHREDVESPLRLVEEIEHTKTKAIDQPVRDITSLFYRLGYAFACEEYARNSYFGQPPKKLGSYEAAYISEVLPLLKEVPKDLISELKEMPSFKEGMEAGTSYLLSK